MKQFRNEASLKAFLKNESKRLGININNIYSTYFSRLLLEGMSRYNNEEVIVKGSFAQFVHLRKFVRPITDIDLASIQGHHDPIMILVQAMCDSPDIVYNFRVKPYQKPNTGIYKIPLVASFGKLSDNGKLRQPLNVDYRENHPCIYEKQIKTVPPVFIGDTEYPIVVPSIEETLAEKLCIIVESNKPELLNTRVKDFYDIYQMHGGEYDLDKFSYYFEKMLNDRNKVNVNDTTTSLLNIEFIKKHEKEWENSKKKYEFLDDEINLFGAVYYTRGVLSEQLQKIKLGKNKSYVLKKFD